MSDLARQIQRLEHLLRRGRYIESDEGVEVWQEWSTSDDFVSLYRGILFSTPFLKVPEELENTITREFFRRYPQFKSDSTSKAISKDLHEFLRDELEMLYK